MKRISLKRKELDGAYSKSPYLFDAVDLYNGDTVKSIIEIAPVSNAVQNVKISIVCNRNGIDYELKPVDEDSYELHTDRYKGMTIWFADKNGVKFKPDKNGVISVTNLLAIPLDIQIWLKAEKYTVEKLNETVVLDDLTIISWYQNA